MNLFLLVNGIVDMMRMPEIATALKRNVVMPPSTGLGIATSAAANLENIPMISSQKQQQYLSKNQQHCGILFRGLWYPALRLAHLVRAITPLF